MTESLVNGAGGGREEEELNHGGHGENIGGSRLEPPASLKAQGTPRRKILSPAGKMQEPKGFAPDGDA